MQKTLLLVFIHGFKGGDDTFADFPEHLRTILSQVLVKISVKVIVYPQYETRGVLKDCVGGFKEWLQNKVIDIEVAAGSPSPTNDPSVRVVLVGHSMGGIVAADTLLSIVSDLSDSTSSPEHTDGGSTNGEPESRATATDTAGVEPATDDAKESRIKTDDPTKIDDLKNSSTLLFPYIQGVLTFDTPFLGIHPGVVAHNAETHINTASAALNAYNSATKFFGGGNKTAEANAFRSSEQAMAKSGSSWANYAMYAGGIATLAAAGGAAWLNRSQLASGWTWATSHLEFVGCLARGAELAQRIESITRLESSNQIGFADLYTQLSVKEGKSEYSTKLLGEERTFCVVPKEAKNEVIEDLASPTKKRKVDSKQPAKGLWLPCVNTKAESEIWAHRSMFTPSANPGYDDMSDKAKRIIVQWVDTTWYEESVSAAPEHSHTTTEHGAGTNVG